ncbi:zinc-binding dehydrogenase [Fulvivirgaceae bacterium LMO-SS25]
MRGLILSEHHPEKLELLDLSKPSLSEGMALVRLKAAALNRRDQWCREGMYPGLKYGVILGSDGAGIVESVFNKNDENWVGKEVVINPNIDWGENPAVQSSKYNILGMPSNGTFAEYVAVPVDRLHLKPKHLDFFQAAALPLGGLTAYRATIKKGNASKGKKVLISGIGGGVATMAFLFANAVGAEVYTTSGSDEKLKKSLDLGAQAVFNYKDITWLKSAKAESGGGFDLIIDSAGGDQLNELMKLLKPGGKLVFYGATLGISRKLELHKMFWSQTSIEGSTMGNDEEFAEMLQLVSDFKIEPIIEEPISLSNYLDAFSKMKDSSQMGKIILEI